jgi:long-chain alkane monooxygenase
MSQSDIIHLAADLSFLHTDYLWRMPGSWVGYDYYSTSEFYEDIARIAQRGVMDMLFFGDTGGTPEDYGGSYEAGVRYGAKWPRHDMAPMIPLMAKAAFGVGFAITMSTTYHHPFYVARFFNALDHVTRGRIAWNAVTSLQERSRELRIRCDDGPRRALQTRAGVSRSCVQAVG